ncbi:hypothetical protein [Pseudoalteromonas sp. BDTF-M6]|uniref:hypothetical protein n=1 Tax=Pseudoalteromonas sp. BDTF-M6 TaxID=2796132 RepID=UPI001BAE90C1|nr:hypothetical protein [Pseudoalteromonas sp. BDTF-M6]MBS3796357.1 hypothetical protein [Pseudoalteromonas sp. BDTF-M6]
MTYTNVIELIQERPALSNDEDFIALLEEGDECIYYVRNYIAQAEFIVVSEQVLQRLPSKLRPITNVFLPGHFFALKQYTSQIQNYVLKSGQMAHYYYLFNAPIKTLFES